MGLFGREKDDNENKGRKGKGPKPMHSPGNRYKSKKELKPLIAQAESDAKKQNMMKAVSKAAVKAGIMGVKAAVGASPKFSHGIKDKETMDMPIVDRERQTTDEQDYDRGDYENSYGPGRKYGEPGSRYKSSGEAGNRYGVRDADTEDMPINTDEKDGAYVATMYGKPHPAQQRMSNMVSAAQNAYSNKHTSSPGRQVKAEKKKSYEEAWKNRDMKTYGDLSKQEYFNEALRQNEMKASTGKWDAPSKPMVGKDPNRFEGRPGVKIMGDESLADKGIKSPTSGNPDSDYFVKDSKILGEVNLENNNVTGVNTPSDGLLQREKPIKPISPGQNGGGGRAKAIAEQKKKEAAARAARGKKPKK